MRHKERLSCICDYIIKAFDPSEVHIYRIYFMESVCVRYLRTSWSSIGNRTSELSERVRFLLQTNECVNTVRIHFPWCIMFIIYLLRFKFLFNDKLCCTDSSQKLKKDVSLSYIIKCFDCRHFLVNSNCLSLTILTTGYLFFFKCLLIL